MRLLLLEDDALLRGAFATRLRADGNVVHEVANLRDARAAIAEADFDCLVFDRVVPDGDSITLVMELDGAIRRPPILMVSGLVKDESRLEGLLAGADDYMTKPVRLDELALRVRKLLVERPSEVFEPLRLGRVIIDRNHRYVSLDGESVHLTPMQYAILEQLALHVGDLVNGRHLLAHCSDTHRHYRANPLHSHVTRLRRIFDGALHFESVWGSGYILNVIGSE